LLSSLQWLLLSSLQWLLLSSVLCGPHRLKQ
jgi:hypothetical protein